jgi:hypothetical protein
MSEDEYLRNWETLKPLVLAKWDRLKPKDLDDIQPLRKELVDLIHRKYKSYPRMNIIQEVENLDQQIK